MTKASEGRSESLGEKPKDESKVIGGKARAEKLSATERKDIAKKAAAARWDSSGSIPRATHAGVLKVGQSEIECYVLKDETRIVSTRGIMKALGRTWRGRKYSGTELPVFLEARNLNPFISAELLSVLSAVSFATPNGLRAEGFKAEILPMICETYLRARDSGVLTGPQERVAKQADVLMRGLAHVGIIALVDEATGYQQDRARDALTKILEKFIAKELQPWISTFSTDFYEGMFRLRGLAYPQDSVKRPQYFGLLTNDLVYKRIAPGVLEELRRVTPRGETGRRKHKYFQKLTSNVGYPKLREHLGSVVAIMKLSSNWEDFMDKMDRLHPRYGETLLLPFNYDDDGRGL